LLDLLNDLVASKKNVVVIQKSGLLFEEIGKTANAAIAATARHEVLKRNEPQSF